MDEILRRRLLMLLAVGALVLAAVMPGVTAQATLAGVTALWARRRVPRGLVAAGFAVTAALAAGADHLRDVHPIGLLIATVLAVLGILAFVFELAWLATERERAAQVTLPTATVRR